MQSSLWPGPIAAVRSGSVSAERYVSTLLDRVERLTSLNAFITMGADGALAAAHTFDAMRACGDQLPPLAGLVIVVKDNINLQGLTTSSGTVALKNARPRIPGGSSGGTVAAIAARIVPSGLGTDTEASTWLPATLAGIAGMRPSVGNGGAERRYHDQDAVMPASHTRDTVGAMGRTVTDVVLLDAVITGSAKVAAVPLCGLRLGVPNYFWDGLDPRLAEVAWAGRERLAAAGVQLVEDDMPGLLELNQAVSFPIVLHEPQLDGPRYLAPSGIKDVTVEKIFANVASPDVKGMVDVVRTRE